MQALLERASKSSSQKPEKLEVKSLADLKRLQIKEKHPLILEWIDGVLYIEVYDDYIE